MLYLDTSLLVSALTRSEADSSAAQEWLSNQIAEELHISNWVITEFSSALSNKMRLGDLDLNLRDEALQTFRRLVHESLHLLIVTPGHFRVAARFADEHRLGLRASDALHLAVAQDNGMRIYTLDRRMATAATAIGISAIRPI